MTRKKRNRFHPQYDLAFKLKILKEAREKKLLGKEVEKIYGVIPHTFYEWRQRYLEGGQSALERKPREPDRKRAGAPKWRDQILAAKRENPWFGAGRILHWLRRTLFLPVSYGEVRTTLKEENLLEKRAARKKRRPVKPQLFERSKPNQLWQSDITAFHIGGGEGRGLRVYLIAFLDDFSRYIVGWGL